MGYGMHPPVREPIVGLPYPGPNEPAQVKSAHLHQLLQLRPAPEDQMYIGFQEVYDLRGIRRIGWLALFVSVYDPRETDDFLKWKILSRAAQSIPHNATLRLWLEIDFARPLSARADGRETTVGTHICSFEEAVFERVSINRWFYDRSADDLQSHMSAGDQWQVSAHWAPLGGMRQVALGDLSL